MIPKELREEMLYAAEQYCRIATGVSGLGSYKFEFHTQLSDVIFDHLFPDMAFGSDTRSIHLHDCDTMHDITDNLDIEIGLPLGRDLTDREAKLYANRLINKLWESKDQLRLDAIKNSGEMLK